MIVVGHQSKDFFMFRNCKRDDTLEYIELVFRFPVTDVPYDIVIIRLKCDRGIEMITNKSEKRMFVQSKLSVSKYLKKNKIGYLR